MEANANRKMPVGVMKISSGKMQGKEYVFKDGQIMTIGRSANNDIQLDESYARVSRNHCSVAYDGQRGRFFIVDTSSTGIYNDKHQKLKDQGYIPANYTLFLANEDCKLSFSSREADVAGIGARSNAAYIGPGPAGRPETNAQVQKAENNANGYVSPKPFVDRDYASAARIADTPAAQSYNTPPASSSPSGVAPLTIIAAALGGILLIVALVIGGMMLFGKDNSDASDQVAFEQDTDVAGKPVGDKDGSTETDQADPADTGANKPDTQKPDTKQPDAKQPDAKKPDAGNTADQADNTNKLTEADLRKIVDAYTSDDLIGTPMTADFDGDGQLEMIAEFGKPFSANGFDLYQQYFVYTNGTKTYEFEGSSGSVLYETTYYKIQLDKGCHFAYTTNWRVEALGGQMYTSGIVGVGPSGANFYLQGDFCSLDKPANKSIEVTYYEEASPGSINVKSQDVWSWNGSNYAVDQGDLSAGVGANLPDGVYVVTDVEKGVGYYAEDELSYMSADDYEGYLTMVSTLRQLDENWKVVKSYSMEHRTFFISGDFKILGYGGDGDPEVYTIDEFNDWFGDENRQKSGLDVQITIKNGLVCEVAICS